MKTFVRHIGRKHTKIQYKNRLQYDETIQYNILQYSRVKKIQVRLLHNSNTIKVIKNSITNIISRRTNRDIKLTM